MLTINMLFIIFLGSVSYSVRLFYVETWTREYCSWMDC